MTQLVCGSQLMAQLSVVWARVRDGYAARYRSTPPSREDAMAWQTPLPLPLLQLWTALVVVVVMLLPGVRCGEKVALPRHDDRVHGHR